MANIIGLILATSALVLIPGPNVALIVANSLRHGLRSGLLTSLGTTTGLAFQLFLVIVGMATVLDVAAETFVWIRWAGVAYLVFLGILAWADPGNGLEEIRPQSGTGTFLRGFGLAVVNPKTLLFSAAFLPQFVVAGNDASVQLIFIAAVYLAVIVVGDALWAVFAASARRFLGRLSHLRNKITSGFLLGAAAGLALSRRTI
jgi:threonine/homoserine/homoserine lactone efflux protein